MKAILIDPKACAVTEVEYDGTLKHLYELTGTDIVEAAAHPINMNHILYVDEEGLRKSGTFCFEIGDELYVGKGLLLRLDEEGNGCAATVSAEYVRAFVWFPKIMVR